MVVIAPINTNKLIPLFFLDSTLTRKTYEIFELLSSDEEAKAIDWLAEEGLYGYSEEVC